MPKLIGFNKALQLIVSGQAVDAKSALKLGIIDQLLPNSQTVLKSAHTRDGTMTYDYQWLTCVLSCMEGKKIGRKPFAIRKREGATAAVNAIVTMNQLEGVHMQDAMNLVVDEYWEESEEKEGVKYPESRGRLRKFLDLFFNLLFCSVTVLQVGENFQVHNIRIITINGRVMWDQWSDIMPQAITYIRTYASSIICHNLACHSDDGPFSWMASHWAVQHTVW